MYARNCRGKKLTFDFAEGLINNNLLVVDRETSSVWSQLDNKAISGPMKETPLSVIPALQTTWQFWKERHPQTRVMVVAGQPGRPYLYRDRRPGHRPTGPRPTTHNTASLGLGISLDGNTMFLPFRELDQTAMPLRVQIGGQRVVIHYRAKALTAWAENEKGTLLPTVLGYEKGWMAFNPQSAIFRAKDH